MHFNILVTLGSFLYIHQGTQCYPQGQVSKWEQLHLFIHQISIDHLLHAKCSVHKVCIIGGNEGNLQIGQFQWKG